MKPQDAQPCYPKSESEGIYKPAPGSGSCLLLLPLPPSLPLCHQMCTSRTRCSRLFSDSSPSRYPSRAALATPGSLLASTGLLFCAHGRIRPHSAPSTARHQGGALAFTPQLFPGAKTPQSGCNQLKLYPLTTPCLPGHSILHGTLLAQHPHSFSCSPSMLVRAVAPIQSNHYQAPVTAPSISLKASCRISGWVFYCINSSCTLFGLLVLDRP